MFILKYYKLNKTMKLNQIHLRFLAATMCLLFSLTASAYDFMEGFFAYNYNADGTSVTVTYRTEPN